MNNHHFRPRLNVGKTMHMRRSGIRHRPSARIAGPGNIYLLSRGVEVNSSVPTMLKLVLISGSLRHGSMNSAVIRAAARCALQHPDVSEASILSLRGIPLFDQDLEGVD